MAVGTLRVVLRLRAVHSLKEKRGMLLPALARLRNDLHCAAAEVDDADRWQSSVVEVACVNSDPVAAEATLRKALESLERGGEMEVVDHHAEVA